MRPEIRDKLLKLIETQEGFRAHPYVDTTGNLTIGYGRNLKSKGISVDEALILLSNDVNEAESEIEKLCAEYQSLCETRKAVLVDMVFNMGIGDLLQFRSMFDAISRSDWKGAAQEMLDSKWHKDVGNRAEQLAYIMETGQL